jgi:hypothetical protein
MEVSCEGFRRIIDGFDCPAILGLFIEPACGFTRPPTALRAIFDVFPVAFPLFTPTERQSARGALFAGQFGFFAHLHGWIQKRGSKTGHRYFFATAKIDILV